MKLKNILVTGAYGFIGSHYAKLLVDNGYNVIVLDKLTYAGDQRRLDGVKHKSYIGDICENKLLTKIIEDNDINIIVNFAAETMVDKSIENGYQFVHSNIVGVYTLLDIMRKKDLDKMIQISTDECYGSILKGSFKENDKLNPGNPYSGSKSAADLLCLSFWNTYKVPVTITRSSNNYGQFQDVEKFIPKMISLAMQDKDLEVYGDGKNVRDWLWVEDNCEAIKSVMEKGRKGEIYNIGANNEITNNQVAKIIADRFKVPINYIKDRPGHDFRYSIDCTKIKEELGWKPVTKFEDGLDKTIDWYIKEEHKKDLEAMIGYD